MKQTHNSWTPEELQWLTDNWLLFAYVRDMTEYLPRHTWSSIGKKAEELRLPPHDMYKQRDKFTIRIWWALQEGPATPDQLKEKTGASNCVMLNALNAFKQAGVIFISHWVKPNPRGHWRPVYAVGDGLNRKKPSPTGRRHTKFVARLENHKGNPFALLLVGAQYGDAECEKDVCAG